jgi:DNA-binding response OmpR family regulator
VRILLVEDNPGDAWIIEDSIRQHSQLYGTSGQVEVLTEGESAMKQIRELGDPCSADGFDLLIADLNLPLVSGDAIIQAWHASTHAAQPVIVVTSSTAYLETLAAEGHQGMFYFQKPMDLEQYIRIGELVQKVLASSTVPLGRSICSINSAG